MAKLCIYKPYLDHRPSANDDVDDEETLQLELAEIQAKLRLRRLLRGPSRKSGIELLRIHKPYLHKQPQVDDAVEDASEDEDEEILKLRLAEIHVKLRVKKLQKSRVTKNDEEDEESEYDSDDSYQSTQEDEECFDEDEGYYCKPALAEMKQPDFGYFPKLARTIRQWNMYAASLGDHATSSTPWARAARAEETRKELDDLVETLRKKVVHLQCDVENLARSVTFFHSWDWYRNVKDLTSFPHAEIHMLLHGDDPGDQAKKAREELGFDTLVPMAVDGMDDFLEYLQDSILAGMSGKRPQDEIDHYKALEEKFHTILYKLTERSSWKVAMHMAVWLNCHIYTRGQTGRAYHMYWHSDSMYEHVQMSIELGDSERTVTYWDFAHAWRMLWRTWERLEDIDDPEPDDEWSTAQLLKDIHPRAKKEVCELTAYALSGPHSTGLPTELTDLIRECTMRAENIPDVLPDSVTSYN